MTQTYLRNGCLLVALTMLALPGCNQSKREDPLVTTTQISGSEWQALEKKRVVFGHQSVGSNILNGVERLAASDRVNLGIREQRTTPAADGGISHFPIGNNGDPISKIEDFASAINAGAAQGADVALMKLCYADFNAGTDARQVANAYIASLESLAQKYPDTSFVAVTVPLTSVQTGSKAWAKRLIGKEPRGYSDNVKRAEFNARLRERYVSSGRLFDLARAEAESTGKQCQTEVDGQTVEVLCPELTTDGGHLNERGQDLVATAFLDFVSSLNTKQVSR
ncbi:MAG: hypothetical protein ACXWE9_02580 [Methylobacter sp.]